MDPELDRNISDHVLRMHRYRSPNEQDGDGRTVFPNGRRTVGHFSNDWCGPVNSSPAADRMSDKNFGANPIFWGRNLSLGPAKNDHVHPLGLAIICEEVKQE